MAFNPASDKVPTSIGVVRVIMSTDEGDTNKQIGGAVEILDAAGDTFEVRRFDDISQHLTAQQITDLQAFMTAMRTKAENEILPP